jgi:hypothetical protein
MNKPVKGEEEVENERCSDNRDQGHREVKQTANEFEGMSRYIETRFTMSSWSVF